MQSFFEAPTDIIQLLSERLTHYDTILATLDAAKNFPITYNKLLNSIRVILTADPVQAKPYIYKKLKGSIKVIPNPLAFEGKINIDILKSFPNLEVIKPQILGSNADLIQLATLPKLISFNFNFRSIIEKNINEDIGKFGRIYCINNDLKNVDFQIYNKSCWSLDPILLLVGTQIYGIVNWKFYDLLSKFGSINGIWGQTMYYPSTNYINHIFITEIELEYKDPNPPDKGRFKFHFTSLSSEDQIVEYCYSVWNKFLGRSYPSVLYFGLPILLETLQTLDNNIFNIFPNVKEFIVFPMFKVDKPIIEYNERIIKFYKPPNNKLIQEDLPELPTYKTMYDAMVAENNLQKGLLPNQ